MSQIERIKRGIMADPRMPAIPNVGIEPLCSAKDCSHQYHRSGTWTLKLKKQAFTGKTKVVTVCEIG